MAPRANWKGSLRLSLVSCPVALYPATSEADKISFNQINKNTGHRIKYLKVDADTGEEVASEDIVKGYKVDTDTYVEVTNEELDNVALESTRTIEIDEFVHRDEIDPRYIIRPYYLCPDGKVGHDAFAVIRETIRDMNMVAIGRVVLTRLGLAGITAHNSAISLSSHHHRSFNTTSTPFAIAALKAALMVGSRRISSETLNLESICHSAPAMGSGKRCVPMT